VHRMTVPSKWAEGPIEVACFAAADQGPDQRRTTLPARAEILNQCFGHDIGERISCPMSGLALGDLQPFALPIDVVEGCCPCRQHRVARDGRNEANGSNWGGWLYNRSRPGWQDDGILVYAPRTWGPAVCWCTAGTDTAPPAGGTFGREADLRCRFRWLRAVNGACSSVRVSCSSSPVSTRPAECTQSPRTPRTLRCRTRRQGERGSSGRRSILRFAFSRGGLSTCTASLDSVRSGGQSNLLTL